MTAIAWTLVGLMAASLGVLSTALFAGFGRIDARIEALGTDLRAEIRALRNTVHDLDVRLTRAGG